MKKIISILLLIFLTSCSFETNKDKEILLLNETIQNQKIEIEKLEKKEKIRLKIEKYRSVKNKIIENNLKEEIEELKKQKDNNLQAK